MEVQQMMSKMPTGIAVDSEWYFLPKPWLDKWELHCYVDIINSSEGEGEVDRNASRGDPGRINFIELFEPLGDN